MGAHGGRLEQVPAPLRDLFSDDAVRAVLGFGDGRALTPARIIACCGAGT
jgi:hypothetical protein